MKLLLACSAGMSTSLVEQSINNYMKEKGIEGHCVAHGAESAKSMLKDFDVVLLGPQVRYMLSTFQKLAGDTPVDVIPAADYALAKGENVFNQAVEILKK